MEHVNFRESETAGKSSALMRARVASKCRMASSIKASSNVGTLVGTDITLVQRIDISHEFLYVGGETGIRTLETVSRLHTFQACAFDHSATSPIFEYFTYFCQSCKTTETRLFIRPFFSIFEINSLPISAVD